MPGRKRSTPVKRNGGRESALRLGYKVRRAGNVTSLTVPQTLASSIPEEARFIPELTADGILFRKVEPTRDRELPAWARRR